MGLSASVNLDNRSVQRILRSAQRSFGRFGYQGTSLNRIATEANVSKSLLHYHFESKEHLFLEVQLLLFRDIHNRVRHFSDSPFSTTQQLHASLETIMVALEQDLDQMLVLLEMHNVANTAPGMRKQLDQFLDEVIVLIVQGIHKTLGPAVDTLAFSPERLARVVRTMFHGLVVEMALASNRDRRAKVRETFEDVREMFIAVLAPHMN